MERSALFFTTPNQVEVCHEDIPDPRPGQLLVRSCCSAISAGTEMLIYRGLFPRDLPVDAALPALAGAFRYPLKYGYALTGEVVDLRPEADPGWLGKRVFSFHPHESAFWADPTELIPIPQDLRMDEAIFLATMETAVNLVLDGQPALGEQVVVCGQGVVGLLAVALLAHFPIDRLISLDRIPLRREKSLELGATNSLDPEDPGNWGEVENLLTKGRFYPGADLVFELTGAPEALNLAIRCAGYSARVIIGSWYGEKKTLLDLGSQFHRSRMQLISSQVSTIAPALSGRWSKERRLMQAWKAIHELSPQRLITHRVSFARAPEAYRLIAEEPEQTLQVILDFE